MLAKFVGISMALTAGCLGAIASSARAFELTEVPVGVVPDPANPQQVLIQQGRDRGIRIGDRGAIAIQGYTVVDGISGADFGVTQLPFSVVAVSERSAIARLSYPVFPYRPLAARVSVLTVRPTDLKQIPLAEQRDTSNAVPPPASTTPEADTAVESPFPVLATSHATWANPIGTQLCGREVGGAYAAIVSETQCAQVTREDILVQAIVSGQNPADVAPADAIGADALYDTDRRLQDVVRFYFLRPDTARARVAIGQEYLRFHHYEQAQQWLAATEVPASQPNLLEDLLHSRTYATYQVGNYEGAIALGTQLENPSSDQLNLIAAAHIQSQQYGRAATLLNELPPLDEIRNNLAIAFYQLDLAEIEACAEAPEEVCLPASEEEPLRQQRARPLLENAAEQSPAIAYNLAILDIRQGSLSQAMTDLLTLHASIASHSELDPLTARIKDEMRLYIDNHNASMDFLQEFAVGGGGLPGGVGDAVGLAGQVAGIGGFLPLALFNVVSFAVAQEQKQALIDRIHLQLTVLYAEELELIPMVRSPDPISANPFS
ncbi:lipopolysaccharide assembly protein LapB [Synechococcus sp. PCC 7336]|uniref:tetratricopeptide repeat protein n=1 Tax=Synechococcus sp. PCC 7336 TaxID=195250 RepID=UPI000362AA6E|nr:hypothetical protein [Synechococcus sp. PCC 7336]